MAIMRIGLVGCGNIGADICIALQKRNMAAEVVALVDADPARVAQFQRSFQLNAIEASLAEAAEASDFLVECANAAVSPSVVEAAIERGCDCLVMSVGGLMARPELIEAARAAGVRLRIPSGALCGLDGIRAAMEGGVHCVTLTTRKPPRGLVGAPYLVERGIDLDALSEATVVFEGNALEAVKAFPANVNVAAALSIAGIGPRETRVRVIADPEATENSHEVTAEGAFGRLTATTVNLPSPRNAKSSYLASLSAVAELRAAADDFARRAALGTEGLG
jgi:aspartate dehydrogenase